jgi:hypothetical protein
VTALAINGFMTTPLFGEVPSLQKYAHNLVLAAAIAALLFVSVRRHHESVRSLQSS